jgi:signal transduction histidine kinase
MAVIALGAPNRVTQTAVLSAQITLAAQQGPYAGKESEVVERVDLSKIVEEMLSLLKVSVTKHAVIKADLGQDLPASCASAAQLRQIVMALITNASDAIGDRDGVIRVGTRRVTLGEVAATAPQSLSDGDYVALEVSDTGCGMSRETQ